MFRNDKCTIKRPTKTKVQGEVIYSEPTTIYENIPCHLSVKTLSYFHLFEPIDWLFLILGVIGGIGAGFCHPMILYLNSKNFSSIGNTSEQVITGPPHIVEMIKKLRIDSINKTMNNSIRKQLIFGAISFVTNFLCGTFWMLIGSRCSYNLKRRYFTLLLAQEQGWFDSFNTYELSTKVQSQLEQIEMGTGIKVGLVISSVIQLIMGFIFAFICYWKIAIVMVSMVPIIVIIEDRKSVV